MKYYNLWPGHYAFSCLTWRGPCLGRNALKNVCLCLLHHELQSFSISPLRPQLSLFVCLIYRQIPKRNRCCILVPLFYSPPAAQEKKWTVVDRVVRVYHCNIWQYDFLRELLLHSIPFSFQEKKRHRGTKWKKRKGPKDGLDACECLWTLILFPVVSPSWFSLLHLWKTSTT